MLLKPGAPSWLDQRIQVVNYRLLGGVVFGLSFGLRFGGLTLLKHYTLRSVMSKNNLLPWKLIPFLDYCTALIFLRRVGGTNERDSSDRQVPVSNVLQKFGVETRSQLQQMLKEWDFSAWE
jgi:hypothetical protein